MCAKRGARKVDLDTAFADGGHPAVKTAERVPDGGIYGGSNLDVILDILSRVGSFFYEVELDDYKLLRLYGAPAGHTLTDGLSTGKIDIDTTCYKALWGFDKPCRKCPIAQMRINEFGEPVGDNRSKIYDEFTKKWLDVYAFHPKFHGSESERTVTVSCYDITGYVNQHAMYDELTAALTYAYFKTKAQEIVQSYHGNNYAVIYIDFIAFKMINSTYGYNTGDKLLVIMARCLRNLLDGDEECYGRISGDKFLILKSVMLNDYGDVNEFAMLFITALTEAVRKMQDKLIKHGHIKFSAGISLVGDINEKNISYWTDKAFAARKSLGTVRKTAFAVYDQKLEKKETERLYIETIMGHALKRREYLVYLQPKIDLKTKKMTAAEALVRWQHAPDETNPKGRMIFPDEFIPLFEDNGFIVNLDFYMFETTLAHMAGWIDSGMPLDAVPNISMNVSRAHIYNDDFIVRIYNLVGEYQVPISKVELELTESLFFGDSERLIAMLEQLRELGFTISIDDFGSGYSSMILLKELPVDILKLDKSFFSGEVIKPKDKIIIENVVNMARQLKLTVVCEGVETEEQVEFLASVNCDLAQGYFYSRPIPVEEFEKKWLRLE